MVGLHDLQRHGHFSHWAQPNSAVDRLIGRRVKTNLPTPPSALRSCQSSPEDIRENDNKAKLSYTRHYDRRHGARSLPSLSPSDEVRVKTPQQSDWSQKGVVSTPADTPRSFVVQTPSGGVYRRNRRHLQATSESTIPPIECRAGCHNVEPDRVAVEFVSGTSSIGQACDQA